MVKINNLEFTIGADPEIFICSETDKGKPVSGYGLIPGTKKKPSKVRRGALQVDGMAAEFNIDPASNWTRFNGNLDVVMNELRRSIPGMDLFTSPVAHFGKDYINAQPFEARDLGCDPDYNAYTGEQNPRPDVETPFRTASGHIHIGWCEDVNPSNVDHMMSCQVLAKALDIYLGLPSMFFPAHLRINYGMPDMSEDENLRRQLYGKAGAFRPKPYGMEYRTLSNLWLHSPETRKLVYYNTIAAIERCFKDDGWMDKVMYGGCEILEGGISEENNKKAFYTMRNEGVKMTKDYK